MTEAPLMVAPYVSTMTTSELMCLMTGGMATIAGGVLVAYIGMGIDGVHLLGASFMNAPAAIVVAKILNPETGTPVTAAGAKVELPKLDVNFIDAAARGAGDGVKLAINVGAMLLAFIALITMMNFFLGLLGDGVNAILGTDLKLSLELVLGYVGAPFAWVMGVPWADCLNVGSLLGQKTVLNEFVAYSRLSDMMRDPAVYHLHPRSVVIATYALCGFANLGSIAIYLGGVGGIAPERRADLARLGFRSVISGTLACFLTATLAGMLV
jgi:CNT family concentrative nucleoside transporter